MLCGHYEGVDQRVIDLYIDEEISIGDYVLTGGFSTSPASTALPVMLENSGVNISGKSVSTVIFTEKLP